MTICGTVRQAADPPMPWTPSLTAANTGETGLCGHTTNTEFSNPEGATGPGTARAAFSFVGGNSPEDCSYRDEASLMVRLPGTQNEGPINSALVHVTAADHLCQRPLRRRSDRCPSVRIHDCLCYAKYQHIPDARTTAVYDLLNAPDGNCRNVITNRSQLVGARLAMRYQAHGFVFDSNRTSSNAPNDPCFRLDLSNRVLQACVEVEDVRLTVGWVLSGTVGPAAGRLACFRFLMSVQRRSTCSTRISRFQDRISFARTVRRCRRSTFRSATPTSHRTGFGPRRAGDG